MSNATFRVIEDHLKLLKNMYVEYDARTEFGAPEIDPKRPYGNSDVFDDMRYILGKELEDGELLKLHKETATALQIALHTGEFSTGVYELCRFRWVKL